MSTLNKLKTLTNLKDLAEFLGYKAKSLSYILYHLPNKYTEFSIPKKNGSTRDILAPCDKLKLLQSRLAKKLYRCENVIDKNVLPNGDMKRNIVSHAFKKKLSIASNARQHTNKRYVFNIDLKDFFPTINFGRVRGYFLKNKHFMLDEKIATLIAQIVCHDGALPQGSPCSPIISNFIASVLDAKIIQLAKKYKVTYSRYADDLTFSTNLKEFPKEIAYIAQGKWVVGNKLLKCITLSGFIVNNTKTSMQHKTSRQIVTGLVVNKKVNIKNEYYKYARSMCHSLFKTGEFHLPSNPAQKGSINQLQGILNHIFHIKKYTYLSHKNEITSFNNASSFYCKKLTVKSTNEKNEMLPQRGIANLYSKFLFYKYFILAKTPVIYTEGKTDIIHLGCALSRLSSTYQELHKNLLFIPHGRVVSKLTNWVGGTSNMQGILKNYTGIFEKFNVSCPEQPVIMVADNDEAGRYLTREYNSPEVDYFHICKNLYVLILPKIGEKDTVIEDYFDQSVLNIEVYGKKFKRSNESKKIDRDTEYDKMTFAIDVVVKNRDTISFEKFHKIFSLIREIISDYNTNKSDYNK